MKYVSNAYKNSMAGVVREQGFAVITFGNTDITARTDGTWSGSGTAWSSFEHVDFSYSYGSTVATLEQNRWCLDGSNVILPADNRYPDGFVSSAIGSSTVIKRFSDPHDLPGVTLTFDTRTSEWATAVTLSWLDENDDVIDSVTVNPTDVTCEIQFGGTDIYGIKIEMAIDLPTHRVRLEEVMYGISKTYTNDDIINAKHSIDIDPLSRRLPSENLEFTIYDPNHEYDPSNLAGIYAYINKNAPIQIQYGYTLPDGTVEWLAPDTYSLSDIPTFQKSQVKFKAVGLIETLTDKYYKSTLGNKNLYDMAVDVLEDADLAPTPQGDDPWDIDDSLKTMYTTAVLPITTHKEALQMIAHAAGCRLYTDDSNIIHLKPFGVSVAGIFSGTFSDNGHEDYSTWQYADSGSPYTQTIVTLELNRWELSMNSPQIIQTVPATKSCFVSDFVWGFFVLDSSPLDVGILG